ncbi:MAG: hypothetical protein JRD02_04450 [Deltaproteobacteria bacterium]|nr:hypothetical protein [Deltaproteobacteria bacterium]
MGNKIRPRQDTAYVLTLFGRTVSEARRNLQRHVLKWSTRGRLNPKRVNIEKTFPFDLVIETGAFSF